MLLLLLAVWFLCFLLLFWHVSHACTVISMTLYTEPITQAMSSIATGQNICRDWGPLGLDTYLLSTESSCGWIVHCMFHNTAIHSEQHTHISIVHCC